LLNRLLFVVEFKVVMDSLVISGSGFVSVKPNCFVVEILQS